MASVSHDGFDYTTAVKIRNGFKSFSKGDNIILRNFCMTLSEGDLYALIGSSGSGKTTVLSSIVGVTKLDHGTISVFQDENISRQQKFIGYMPQETALYESFSIFENLMFFGALQLVRNTNSNSEYLIQRCKFLVDLLGLPSFDKKVSTLSGGQRRRVSFGVALLNEPRLLILDEPTAGADPLIRERIWNHLQYLAREKKCSVLLSTHSIGDAVQSTIVGILKDGHLIAETEPHKLLAKTNTNTMETAITMLYKECRDNDSLPNFRSNLNSPDDLKIERRFEINCSITRIVAMAKKNLAVISRNYWMMIFMVLVPVVCMVVSCVPFVYQAHNIPLGLVNLDIENSTECSELSDFCSLEKLSCNFITNIPSDIINLKPFQNISDARNATMAGNTWGFIYFPKGYSEATINVYLTRGLKSDMLSENEYDEEEANWNNSKIVVNLDQTNKLISAVLINTLFDTLETAFKGSLEKCGFNAKVAEYSLQYSKPIIGSEGLNILHFVAPGLMIGVIYFFPLTVSIRFISEHRQGTLQRCQTSGAQYLEILTSYAILEVFILSAQSLLIYIIAHYGFGIGEPPSATPLNAFCVIVLCIFQGLGGLALGVFLGTICHEEIQAAIIVMAIFISNLLLCGLFWPLEGMPFALQKVSLILPMTLPGEALRSLLIREWTVLHPAVWSGFLVSIVYTILFSLFTAIFAYKS